MIAGKLKRMWDETQTPYQRLTATRIVAPTVAAGRAALHAATNPRRLRQQMYDGLAQLWEQPTTTTWAAD